MSSLDEGDYDLAMLPPIEKANAENDMDNDVSDDIEWWSCTPSANTLAKFNMWLELAWQRK